LASALFDWFSNFMIVYSGVSSSRV